eukprot:5143957-Prymnesium_polylepis.1
MSTTRAGHRPWSKDIITRVLHALLSSSPSMCALIFMIATSSKKLPRHFEFNAAGERTQAGRSRARRGPDSAAECKVPLELVRRH